MTVDRGAMRYLIAAAVLGLVRSPFSHLWAGAPSGEDEQDVVGVDYAAPVNICNWIIGAPTTEDAKNLICADDAISGHIRTIPAGL